jgi:deazaflavin-dependent oxidoreductase (nitroreductase family)
VLTEALEQHQFCYLTTKGRSTGRPHRIEIWFAILQGQLFVNSGGGKGSDWVKNLIADPSLKLEIGDEQWLATASIREDAIEHPARQRFAERYQGWRSGERLSSWATDGLLIEIRVGDSE